MPTYFVVLRVRLNRHYQKREEDTQHRKRKRKRIGPSCCSSSDCNQGGGRPRLNWSQKSTMALESRITQEEIKKEPEKPIDREKVDSSRGFQSLG